MKPVKSQVPSDPASQQVSVHQDLQVIQLITVRCPSYFVSGEPVFSSVAQGKDLEKRKLNDGSPLTVSSQLQSFQASVAGNMEQHDQINPAVRNAAAETEQFDEAGSSVPFLETNSLEPENKKITLSEIESLFPRELLELFRQHGITGSGDSKAAPTIYSETGAVIKLSTEDVKKLKLEHAKLHVELDSTLSQPYGAALLKAGLYFDKAAKITGKEWYGILDKRGVDGKYILSQDEKKMLWELRDKGRGLIDTRNWLWKKEVIAILVDAENRSDDGELSNWVCSLKQRKLNDGSSFPLSTAWHLLSETGDAIRGRNQAMPVVQGVEQSNEVSSSVTISGEDALASGPQQEALEKLHQYGITIPGYDETTHVVYDEEKNEIELLDTDVCALSAAHGEYKGSIAQLKLSRSASVGVRNVLKKLENFGVKLTVVNIKMLDDASFEQVRDKQRGEKDILRQKEKRVLNLFRQDVRARDNVYRAGANETVAKILLQAEIRSLRKRGQKIEKSRKIRIEERCKLLGLDINPPLPVRPPGGIWRVW